MKVSYSEDTLVEQPAIELFKKLGWNAANCYNETFGPNGSLGRETAAEVVLVSRLRPALEKLNRDLPAEAITIAIEALTRDRSAMSSTEANRQIYKLLKDGVRADLTGMHAPSGSAPSSYAPSPPAPLPRGEGRLFSPLPVGEGLGERVRSMGVLSPRSMEVRSSVYSGTHRAAAKAIRWFSSHRKSCASCRETGRS